MLSRKLLVSGASMLALTLVALGATGSASASAGTVAGGHHTGTPVHAGSLPWSGIRPKTLFLGHLVNYSSHLCLGISDGARDGDAVQAGCVAHPDQEWTEGNPVADGFYRIYNGYGQCLGVQAGETRDNADVVATRCLGGHNDQLWQGEVNVEPHCDYPYFAPIFNNKATGKVIGVENGSPATGAPIVIYEFQHQCNNQYWGHTGT